MINVTIDIKDLCIDHRSKATIAAFHKIISTLKLCLK